MIMHGAAQQPEHIAVSSHVHPISALLSSADMFGSQFARNKVIIWHKNNKKRGKKITLNVIHKLED